MSQTKASGTGKWIKSQVPEPYMIRGIFLLRNDEFSKLFEARLEMLALFY
jgi:hypothetical protein